MRSPQAQVAEIDPQQAVIVGKKFLQLGED